MSVVTRERLEKALLTMAQLVVIDPKYMPIFERVEQELEAFKKDDPLERARALLAARP